MQTHTPIKKQLMSIETFLEVYSLSRSKFYSEVKTKSLRITKLGSRTYIALIDAESWLKNLREENE